MDRGRAGDRRQARSSHKPIRQAVHATCHRSHFGSRCTLGCAAMQAFFVVGSTPAAAFARWVLALIVLSSPAGVLARFSAGLPAPCSGQSISWARCPGHSLVDWRRLPPRRMRPAPAAVSGTYRHAACAGGTRARPPENAAGRCSARVGLARLGSARLGAAS